MIRRFLSSLLLLLALTGPARAQDNYALARARDLRDILTLELGTGYIFAEVNFRATDYLTLCIGAAENHRWQILGKWIESPDAAENPRYAITRPRYWFPSRYEANVGIPSSIMSGCFEERIPGACTWVSVPEFVELEGKHEFYVKNWLVVDDYAHQKPLTEKFDLAAGVTVPLLSARIGVSPGSLVDFLAGLFGFDPAGDDTR